MTHSYPPTGCIFRRLRRTDWGIAWLRLEEKKSAILFAIASVLGFLIIEVLFLGDYVLHPIVLIGMSISCLSGIGSALLWPLLSDRGFFTRDRHDYWVVERYGRFVAYAMVRHIKSYSVLLGIFVLPSLRRRGIGSYLLAGMTEEIDTPLYLVTSRELAELYARSNFVEISSTEVPREIRGDLKDSELDKRGLLIMVHGANW